MCFLCNTVTHSAFRERRIYSSWGTHGPPLQSADGIRSGFVKSDSQIVGFPSDDAHIGVGRSFGDIAREVHGAVRSGDIRYLACVSIEKDI